MLMKEYRICMPLTVEEVRSVSLYLVIVMVEKYMKNSSFSSSFVDANQSGVLFSLLR